MAIRKRFRTRAHPMGELYLDGRRVQVLESRMHKRREQFLIDVGRRQQEWIDARRFTKTSVPKSTRPKPIKQAEPGGSLRQHRKAKGDLAPPINVDPSAPPDQGRNA